MKRGTVILSLAILFGLFLALFFSSGQVYGQPLSAPIDTSFTYQGRLVSGGTPANGMYDFTFTLYDALSGGAQVGGAVTRSGVTVTDGLFTVQLDFGAVFDGTALYLEIGVRPGSGGAYTTLAPRQALTAAPYARYAAQVPWSGLVGVPPGFADGIDDGSTYTAGTGLFLNATQFSILDSYQLPQTCINGQVPQWNGSAWTCTNHTAYTAGTGMSLSGGQFSLLAPYQLPQGCANGQISQWNGSAWVCATGTGSTYTAGSGINISGSVISAAYAGSGGDYGAVDTLARSDHTHSSYIRVGDAAGGDLTGTYPNPSIAANAVGSAEIADGSIDMADTRNWMGYQVGNRHFVGGSDNPDLYVWAAAFTPSANGICMAIANAYIISGGHADDDPQPILNVVVNRGGFVDNDLLYMPFTPQDVTSTGSSSASSTYVVGVRNGESTSFGCRVTDPDGNWDEDERVDCQISYFCQ